jgi:phage terminase Nu1 subunit (DNA packaging protein)
MTRPTKEKELLNTSELARRSGLDRATVAERLAGKGVQPREKKSNVKRYDAEEALAALQGSDERSGLRKAQTMKTAAEAARAKIKLEKEKGELVSIHDVRADIQAIANEIRLHFLTRAQALAPQLRGQKVARIEALLREDAEQFFGELRAEHEGYLSEQAED